MSKSILVVEDQEDNRQIIRDMLTFTDYEIVEAESGEEALAAVAKQRPDLILMDIQLPGIDGYEVTRRIKADPAMRSIPIIAVTSYALSGEEQNVSDAIRIGDCFPFRNFAKNQSPCNFRLLQQYRPEADSLAVIQLSASRRGFVNTFHVRLMQDLNRGKSIAPSAMRRST